LACYCCGFDFEAFYGAIAHNRAIVHHLETFHGKSGEKRASTVDDVRVVCANCHYVIHSTQKLLGVDVLKAEIEKSWTRWSCDGVSRHTPVASSRRAR
jgi:5-methylcytosine-specific restriction protein A